MTPQEKREKDFIYEIWTFRRLYDGKKYPVNTERPSIVAERKERAEIEKRAWGGETGEIIGG
jgi:hypothetical protein